MNTPIRIFVDSDVVISSLISHKGAAYALFQTATLTRSVSNVSLQELRIVIGKLHIPLQKLNHLVRRKCRTVKLTSSLMHIKRAFGTFVADANDAHIVAGALRAKATFLITYNLKHFKAERIKRELDIIVLSPAQVLQYLRSIN